MPESPEVECFAQSVAERIVGRAISGFTVGDFAADKTRRVDPGVLEGRTVTAVHRHGKYVDVVAEPWHLVVSFGRHGWGEWAGDDPRADDAPRLIATLSVAGHGSVEFTDVGAFRSAAFWIVREAAEVPGVAALGPDPSAADFAQADVDAVTVGRRKQLKAVLQEQASFAGIGNAYSDEILFAARLAPTVQAAALDASQRERLFHAMTDEIRGAIAARRSVPLAELKAAKAAAMRVHGRAGEPCPVCGGEIADFTFSGTTAQWCPTCQSAG